MMSPFEEKQVLSSFAVLVDSREQQTERAERRYAAFGAEWRRCTLSYGDYTYNATLPDGRRIHNEQETIRPLLAIERKMNLDELAQCFTRSRARFQREFERARENGSRIILIVEDASWENLLNGKYRSKVHPEAFAASIEAWTIRYGLNVIFCKEETSGKLIRDFLYRDLKERLENGEFDKEKEDGVYDP